MFFEDANGLRLGLCDDPANCFFFAPNPTLPTSFPGNWPDEAFYWAGDSIMDGGAANPGLKALIVLAREAAFFNGPVVDGDQIVFSRIRFAIDGIPSMLGHSYKITHPYGINTILAGTGLRGGGVNREGLAQTLDIGITQPGEFTAALAKIDPFLIPATANLNILKATPGALLDTTGGLTMQVQGSPFGTNFFRIEGPNIGDAYPDFICADITLGGIKNTLGMDVDNDCVETDQFSLMGRVAAQHGAGVDQATYGRSGLDTFVNISANSVENQTLVAGVNGGPMYQMTEGAGGNYFLRLQQGSHFSLGLNGLETATVMNLTDSPATIPGTTLVTDEVNISSAQYDLSNGLLVLDITSSDLTNTPVLNDLTGLSVHFQPPVIPLTLISTNGGPGFLVVTYQNQNPPGTVDLINQSPPFEVIVSSAHGGRAITEVLVLGPATPVGAPLLPGPPPDQTPPVIVILGDNPVGVIEGGAYNDAGATAFDIISGDLTAAITVTNTVNTALAGSYQIVYSVSDAALNSATATRIVEVIAPAPTPVPPPLPVDTCSLDKAEFNGGKETWKIQGSSSIDGLVVTVYLGADIDTSRPIGSSIVNGGSWSFNTAQGSASIDNTFPLPLDSQVWVQSERGCTGSGGFKAK
ncbi:MAG: DUF5011 domain-containing protein [Nitrospinaceae bacterium]